MVGAVHAQRFVVTIVNIKRVKRVGQRSHHRGRFGGGSMSTGGAGRSARGAGSGDDRTGEEGGVTNVSSSDPVPSPCQAA